jgi:hypothetical protein
MVRLSRALYREYPTANLLRREHPEANEVFVTGTFDDWGKTQQLHKVGDVFEKSVDLPNSDKILYKVGQERAASSAHIRHPPIPSLLSNFNLQSESQCISQFMPRTDDGQNSEV